MSKGKWGESFLKSGLPLEHLTLATFKSMGWICSPSIEVERPNREGQQTWFELDLEAHSPFENQDTTLSFLVECKYHDASRFWFFLPHEPERWGFNDRFFNCGPIQTLAEPRNDKSALKLIQASTGGIVVSEDGTKQDNAVHTAIQQIANAFVPICLSEMYDYLLLDEDEDEEYYPAAVAKVPMIVTNATLFRLKENVTDLDAIRNALTPHEVADEIPWTWHYFDPSMSLLKQNNDAIKLHISTQAEFVYRFPHVKQRIWQLCERPNWIAIVNINQLSSVITEISDLFMSLPTLLVEEVVSRRKHSTD
ncbi:MAG: hypothetical protein WCO45_18280 [Pseudanabaena sp. ELA607]|jgi:hypothetical protein